MYSNLRSSNIQESISNQETLFIPSSLKGFTQHSVSTHPDQSGEHSVICFSGVLSELEDKERVCPHCCCGQKMHVKATRKTMLRHLPFGGTYSCVELSRQRLYCEHCRPSHSRAIPFKAANHQITESLLHYVEDLLSTGKFTVKAVAELAGLNAHTVASIDKARLSRIYVDKTEEGKEVLKKPATYAKCLAIDEFKLHDGHQFATHIIDLETGHVLWIARGKKKQVVYDFIDHVGMEWMDHVEAVACDMNSDFQEAFEERCEWISIVFDRFHIVKNFNEKVISEVRKDIQKELAAAIIDICRGTKNEHFQWFARLLENHFEGIISHASYKISSGKIEGINNKIKTVRRHLAIMTMDISS